MDSKQSDGGRTVLMIVGVALMVFGAWALAGRAGFIPEWLTRNWAQLRAGISLIVLGGLVIWLARGGFRAPAAGTRLYRTRDDKWVAGVLGGLARYFGIDATLLRLLVIALAVLGEGWVIGPYILMAILVPKEPQASPEPVPIAAPAPPEGGGEAAATD